MTKWTDDDVLKLFKLRRQGLSWHEIADKFPDYNHNQVMNAFYRYDGLNDSSEIVVESLRQSATSRKSKTRVAKENKALLEYIEQNEALVDSFKAVVKKLNKKAPKRKKVKKSGKRKCTMEVMLSDLHYGKLTSKFNHQQARKCAQKMADVVGAEFERKSQNYNVESIVTLLMGDIIENASFHGIESFKGCEFGDAEQVEKAVHSIFNDYILPIAELDTKLTFICVTGNHDRNEQEKSFQSPGKYNLTWIIYKMLEMLCQKSGIKATFHIPEGINYVYKVYGDNVLVEHGDFIRGGMTRNSVMSHMSKRSEQLGEIIQFMRLGHFHEYSVFGRGKVIVNGSFPGDDDYSKINGYKSESMQVINYYVENFDRPTSFYCSFPVYLG